MQNFRAQEFMRAYQNGDGDAFAAIYSHFSGRVYSYLRAQLSTDATDDAALDTHADALLAQIFWKFHQTRHNYQERFPLQKWIFVLSHHTLSNYFKAAGRAPDPSVEFGDILSAQVKRDASLINPPGLKELEIWEDIAPDQRQAVEQGISDDQAFEEITDRIFR